MSAGRHSLPAAAAIAVLLLTAAPAAGGEWALSGFVGGELRYFPDDPAFPDQDDVHLSPSVSAEPEVVYGWGGGDDRLTFVPFGRWDAHDERRTHFDIREANYLRIEPSWDLLVGIDRVFWGTTESRHLVNIVNQVDQVEDIDEEEFLGQPMVNLNLLGDWGRLALFVLPGFRERTFPDEDARLRGPFPISSDAEYESGAEEAHVDFAVRYGNTFGPVDLGVAHFHGTGREPRFLSRVDPDGGITLVPFYDQIDQTSLDMQAALGSVLLKLEAITRSGQGDRFYAAVGGFEYTVFGAFGTRADVGLLAEYLYDGRDAPAPPTALEDDIFLGIRLTPNDEQDTNVLAGAIVDREDQATALSLEASRRIGDRWRVYLEARAFANVPSDDDLAGIEHDDFVRVRLSWFF